MIPIEQNKIENYIADYYRSYFQMDSVYNCRGRAVLS